MSFPMPLLEQHAATFNDYRGRHRLTVLRRVLRLVGAR